MKYAESKQCPVCGIKFKPAIKRGKAQVCCSRLCDGNTRRKSLQQRFDAKVKKVANGCWLWTGVLNLAGYGMIAPPGGLGKTAVNKKAQPLLAHRVSYELHVGPIPDGIYLDHLCRQPRCVNPAHLDITTPAQNSLRGERRKWSEAQVAECRRLRAEGLTLYKIQDRTGIPHQTVWTFISGKRRNVPLAAYQTLDAYKP
jgi:hypothetical protein